MSLFVHNENYLVGPLSTPFLGYNTIYEIYN